MSTARQVELVSSTSTGGLGDYHSGYNALALSRDGSVIGFYTYASNFFAPDPYGADYALKDMDSGAVIALTQSIDGNILNGTSGGAVAGYDTLALSANASYAVLGSSSNLLVSTSDGSDEDIFLFDLVQGSLGLISEAQGGVKSSHAYTPDISDNGRYVVFSASENLVAAMDLNGISDSDVYWFDALTNELRLVSGEFNGSVQGGGNGSEGDSSEASVSNDGRYVVFESMAPNLRPESTGGGSHQLFLRDMVTDQLYLISTDGVGAPANSNCNSPEMTPDARYVVFGSAATNLVEGASGWNIFRLDLYTGVIDVVNTTLEGTVVDGAFNPEITPDGRYVVFEGTETELVPGSSGTGTQIYVKDLVSGAVAMVSTNAAGNGGNYASYAPRISDDGQYIVFNSRSALVSGDTNGYDDVYRVFNPVYAWEGNLNNDVYVDSPETESIVDQDGLDVMIYAVERGDYSVAKASAGYVVTFGQTSDQLAGIERLRFWDQGLALDIDGHAGEVAKLLTVVFGAESVANKTYAGIGLELLDRGMSYEELGALAVSAAGASTREDIVHLLWNNIFGSHPGSAEAQPFVDMLALDLSNAGSLTTMAADYAATVGVVDLEQLSLSGLAYL